MSMETAINIAQNNFQPNRPSSLGDITNFVREKSARNPDKFTATFVTKNKMEFKILEKRRVISSADCHTISNWPFLPVLVQVRSRDSNFFRSLLPAGQRA